MCRITQFWRRRRDVARHPSSDGCMICSISIRWPCRLPIDRMPAVERPAIDADRCVVTAMLDDLLRAVVMESAQALQLTEPKRIDVTSVRNDMVHNAGCSDPAFARAHATERLDLQLMARPFAPTFSVQMSPPAHAQSLAQQRGREQEECADARCHKAQRHPP